MAGIDSHTARLLRCGGILLLLTISGCTENRSATSYPAIPGRALDNARLVLDQKWGDGEDDLGIVRPEGSNSPLDVVVFGTFFAQGDSVYIVDQVRHRLVHYEKNKLKQVFPYPPGVNPYLAVTRVGSQLFGLDLMGAIWRLDMESGRYDRRESRVREEHGGSGISYSAYHMYGVGNVLIVAGVRNNWCFDIYSIEQVSCGQMQRHGEVKASEVYFDNGTWTMWENGTSYLFDRTGTAVGGVNIRALGDLVLYDTHPVFQPTKQGVYVLKHSEDGARIYFIDWYRVPVQDRQH